MKQILALLLMLAVYCQGMYAKNANKKDDVCYKYVGNNIIIKQGGDSYSLKKGTIIFLPKSVDLARTSEITVTLVNKNKKSKNKATIKFNKSDNDLSALFEKNPNYSVRYKYIGNDTTIMQGEDCIFLKNGEIVFLPKTADLTKASEITALVDKKEIKIKRRDAELNTLFEIEDSKKQNKENVSSWHLVACLFGGILIGFLGPKVILYTIRWWRKKKANCNSSSLNEEKFTWVHDLQLDGDFPSKPYLGEKKKKRTKEKEYLVQTLCFQEPVKQECIENFVKEYYQEFSDELRSQINDFIINRNEELPQGQGYKLEIPIDFRSDDDNKNYVKLKGFGCFIRPISVEMIMPNETKESELLLDDELKDLQESLIGQDIAEQVEEKLKVIKNKIVNFNESLKEKHGYLQNSLKTLEEQKAILHEENEGNKQKINDLKGEKEKAEAENGKINEELKQTKSLLAEETAKTKILETQIESKDKTIEELKDESKEYNQLLTFYKPCVDDAKTALAIVDDTIKVQTLAGELYQLYKEHGKDMDGFCYYMEHISQKYKKSMERFHGNEDAYNTELRLLANTGLAIKGGWIDKMLVNKKSDNEKAKVFVLKLYTDYMSSFIGFAVIMADEYAYQLKAMVENVDTMITKKIALLSEDIRRLSSELGYKINYARPMTSIHEYDNVKNEEYVDTHGKFNKNTIIVVTEMAVNFGTSQSKTKVKAQI